MSAQARSNLGSIFDHMVALPESEDRAGAVIGAMASIEADYVSLRGVLPQS